MLNKEEKPKYTKEYLEKILGNIYKNDKPISKFAWKHNTWEENGERFSAWTFKTDRGSFTTGDGGKEAFDKLFLEELEKYE